MRRRLNIATAVSVVAAGIQSASLFCGEIIIATFNLLPMRYRPRVWVIMEFKYIPVAAKRPQQERRRFVATRPRHHVKRCLSEMILRVGIEAG